MNTERIKELQNFANEFNNRLKISEESQIEENKINKFPLKSRIKKPYSAMTPKNPKTKINLDYKHKMPFLDNDQNNPKIKRTIKSSKKGQRKLNNNIYKNLLPWIPPHYVGNYFDDLKILQDKHNLTAWEKVNNIII
jgi:hypothetical protein